MTRVAVDYFRDLFESDVKAPPASASQGIEPLVSTDDNSELLRPFTGEEVRNALFSMHRTKSPGPDGMSALFYQKYWHIVGPEVCRFVIGILNGDDIPSDLNYTYITLIPKVTNPCRMKDLRPISLCNVIYKIVSKVLANRLKKCLGKVVSQSQSAFVPGRLITDNVLAAFEIFHHMKTRRGGRKGYMALKLDMAKAYDRVEWGFLEHCMRRFGFEERWVNLIMRCVSSVSFSVLVEGCPSERFTPGRGLRQGDPLSPYLFLLCAEGLSGLIRESEREGRLTGISIARNAPRVSHLFFADDSIIFASATCQQSNEIGKILQVYGAASGQQVNLAKSEISFSKNVSETRRAEIQQIIGVREVDKHEKYLGLPTMVGRSKRVIFNSLRERVWKKVKGWKEKTLSSAGKEVLLKAVVQAIPMYTMSCFLLPVELCKEIEQIMCNFWWGDGDDKRRVHWLSWKRMCATKETGGLGFRDLEAFNVAILAKQGWRLLQEPSSLLARILSAKYYPRTDFMGAKLGANPSYTWRSLMRGRELLEEGLRWSVGNGSNIGIWEDRWIPRPRGFKVLSQAPEGLEELRVIELIDWGRGEWDEEKVRQLLWQPDAELVLQMRLVRPEAHDEMVWHYSKNGIFSVRSAYWLAMDIKAGNGRVGQSDGSKLASLWRKVWGIRVPPRIRNLVWRACKEVLPCKSNLCRRKVLEDSKCEVCGLEEDGLHALFKCRVARMFWKCVPEVGRWGKGCTSVMDFFERVHRHRKDEGIQVWSFVLEAVWRARNGRIFEGHWSDPRTMIEKTMEVVDEFRMAEDVGERNGEQMNREGERKKWCRPSRGAVKVNCDAAVDETKGCGVGFIVRNEEGQVLLMGAKRVQDSVEVELVEAEALLWAVRAVRARGFARVEVETDCLSLVSKLRKDGELRGTMGMLLQEVKEIAREFDQCSWLHVRRDGNAAAHQLAVWRPSTALIFDSNNVWPAGLDAILCEDLK